MTNPLCPDYSSHDQNACEQLGYDLDAILSQEASEAVDALAAAEYAACEGH